MNMSNNDLISHISSYELCDDTGTNWGQTVKFFDNSGWILFKGPIKSMQIRELMSMLDNKF